MIRQTFTELTTARRAGHRVLLWRITHPRRARLIRLTLAEHHEVLHRLAAND